MKTKLSLLSLLVCLFVVVPTVEAKVGVGVNTGKISVDEQLSQGGIYVLPSIGVSNNGDETSLYSLRISYHQDQTQLTPPGEWFTFTPTEFELKPKESQIVEIRLSIPVTTPGAYFAYIEAYPVAAKKAAGNTSVGVAAATKLDFTIAPSSIFQAVGSRVITLWQLYMPWSGIITVIFFLVLFLFVISRKVKIHVEVAGHHHTQKRHKHKKKPSLLGRMWRKYIHPRIETMEEDVLLVEHEAEVVVEDAFAEAGSGRVHFSALFLIEGILVLALFLVTTNLPEVPGPGLIDPLQLTVLALLMLVFSISLFWKHRKLKSGKQELHVVVVALLFTLLLLGVQIIATPSHTPGAQIASHLVQPEVTDAWVCKGRTCQFASDEGIWTVNLNARTAGAALSLLSGMLLALVLLPPVHIRRKRS